MMFEIFHGLINDGLINEGLINLGKSSKELGALIDVTLPRCPWEVANP